MAKLAGATPKFIFAGDDQGFKVSADQIEGSLHLKPNQILNSPSNLPVALQQGRDGGDCRTFAKGLSDVR